MKRHFLPYLLAALVIVLMLSIPVSAEEIIASGTKGEFTWTLNDLGKLVISGPDHMVYISSESWWGEYKDIIREVIIEEPVINIGQYMFYDCNNLVSVSIPDTVIEIGSYAFADCDSLSHILIPDSVEHINPNVFDSCKSLKSVTMPMPSHLSSNCFGTTRNIEIINITSGSIPTSFFEGFTCLENVTIQEQVSAIGAKAFSGCTNLTSITILGTLSVNSNAFTECTSLKHVNISDLRSWISCSFYEQYANPLCYGAGLYLNGELLEGTLKIPEGITKIGSYAFANYLYMDNVEIPLSVTEYDTAPFFGCTNLKHMVYPASSTDFWGKLFGMNQYNYSIAVDQPSPYTEGFFTYYLPQKLDSITIIGEKISKNEFINCSTLKNVTISSSIEYFGQDAFSGCAALECVNTDNIISWCQSYFYNLRSSPMYYADNFYVNDNLVTDLSIPEGVQEIKQYAFSNCKKLVSISIPASIHNIEQSAFYGCSNLEEMCLPYAFNNDSIGEQPIGYIFGRDSYEGSVAVSQWNLGTFYIPQKLKHITILGEYLPSAAFVNCSMLTRITLGEAIVHIDGGTFRGCSGLAEFPDMPGVTSIGYQAFANCTGLTDIVIPTHVVEIEQEAFVDCSGLKSVVIPDSVTSLGYRVLFGCSTLEELTIPYVGSCVNLPEDCPEDYDILWEPFGYIFGKDPFDGASPTEQRSYDYDKFGLNKYMSTYYLPDSLRSVTVLGNELGMNAFRNCENISSITLGSGVSSIDADAFCNCVSLKELNFQGNAPSISSTAFNGVVADAYYPTLNSSWSWDVMKNYGGDITWICESCRDGHSSVTDKGKAATCTEVGLTDGSHCNRCGKVITAQEEIPSLGHSWNDGVVTKEPNEEETGVCTYTCTVCQNTKTESIPELDHEHNYTAEVIAPTCTEAGFTTYTCTCGDIYIEDDVAALGHTEVIDEAFASTCDSGGLTEGRHCSVCGKILTAQEEIAALGHTWDEGVVTKEPTKDELGICTYTCEACGETKTEEIPFEDTNESTVKRIAGNDRIATALAVATELKAVLGVDKFDAIIIAAGGTGSDKTKFADALSGSYLASVKKAPILLYTKGDLAEENLTFIRNNLRRNGTIYLLGGEAAVPAEVSAALSGYSVKRLKGNDRYETNRVILNEVGLDNAEEILIATGTNFADCLSASATGLPIMLVKGTNTELNAQQIEFLNGLKGKKFTILGGEAAVSAELEAAIEAVIGAEVERIKGEKREETSTMIAQKYFPNAKFALVAYSKNYPDGLAGGVLANALGAPLLLTNSGNEKYASAYIEETGVESGYILGGTSVVTDETAKIIFGLA